MRRGRRLVALGARSRADVRSYLRSLRSAFADVLGTLVLVWCHIAMRLTQSQRAGGFLLFAAVGVTLLVIAIMSGDDATVEYMLSRSR